MPSLRAPELVGRGGWIGAADDFGLARLRGKVVVLHFWRASSAHCVRVLDELKPIEARFPTQAVVIGVHSPKFPYEHEHAAVELAVQRLGVRHPVLDDPELATWEAYGVRGWPTLVVIDTDGLIVGGVAGEGTGATVEQAVEKAAGSAVAGPVTGLWGSMPLNTGLRTLSFPSKVAVDGEGRRLAIADTGNGRIVVCDLKGRVEQVYPLFTRPGGVRFDGDRLLVCDTGADRVVAVDRSSGTQAPVDEGVASPSDVGVLGPGSFVVAEAARHRLRGPHPAGDGQAGLADGVADGARLAQPAGVAVRPDGTVAFVDTDSSALRLLTADGEVRTLVGQGLFDWGASDGPPEAAALQAPLGVTATATSIYVADSGNSLIREWTGAELRTVPVAPGELSEPGGIDVLSDGRLVVADTNHHRIVVTDPATGAVEALNVDESWLGTGVGDPFVVTPGAPLRLPYTFDTGRFELDPTVGPPVQVSVTALPGSLLSPGPRRWALTGQDGAVEVVAAAAPGDGVLVVEVEVAVCNDDEATTLRAKQRHDLTITAE